MEKTLKFNSQVATNRSQSERLLALGLKKETADMCYQIAYWDCGLLKECSQSLIPHNIIGGDSYIPAWSLYRLLSLIPREFEVDILIYGRNYKMPIEMHILPDLSVIYTDLNKELYKGFYYTNIYDSLISCIEWQVEQGYFNKEYLV